MMHLCNGDFCVAFVILLLLDQSVISQLCHLYTLFLGRLCKSISDKFDLVNY